MNSIASRGAGRFRPATRRGLHGRIDALLRAFADVRAGEGVAQFAWINVGLVLVWIALAIVTGLEFRRRLQARAQAAA